MTMRFASEVAPPVRMGPAIRWSRHCAAASALLIAAAMPAAASDIGSIMGGVMGGILSQGLQQQQRYYQQPQPQPQYYQYQQPQYYQYQQPQQSYHHSTASTAAARRKAAAAAEAKRKQEEAEKKQQEAEATKAAALPAPTTIEAGGIIDVGMTRKGGNLWIPAKINDVVAIDFVIDSGASDITLPRDVYLTLIRSGTLTKANYIGATQFGIANGSEVKGLKFKLASLQVGNQVLKDVVASVMPSDTATPLLGLSFLSRFQSWSIDNKSGTLKLVPIGANPAAATQTAAADAQPLPEPPDAAPAAAPAQTAAAAQAAAPQTASVTTNAAMVMQAASPAPKLAAAAPLPRSGHVATAAFMVKDAPGAAAPAAAAATAPTAHLPEFPGHTNYADARASLLALGYGPAPLPDGAKCDGNTDSTCFPERTACAKADTIQCNYLWRRGDELIKVKTVAIPPTVSAVECQVNCK